MFVTSLSDPSMAVYLLHCPMAFTWIASICFFSGDDSRGCCMMTSFAFPLCVWSTVTLRLLASTVPKQLHCWFARLTVIWFWVTINSTYQRSHITINQMLSVILERRHIARCRAQSPSEDVQQATSHQMGSFSHFTSFTRSQTPRSNHRLLLSRRLSVCSSLHASTAWVHSCSQRRYSDCSWDMYCRRTYEMGCCCCFKICCQIDVEAGNKWFCSNKQTYLFVVESVRSISSRQSVAVETLLWVSASIIVLICLQFQALSSQKFLHALLDRFTIVWRCHSVLIFI